MTNSQLIENLQALLKQAIAKQQKIEVVNSEHGNFANRVKALRKEKAGKALAKAIDKERVKKQAAIAARLPKNKKALPLETKKAKDTNYKVTSPAGTENHFYFIDDAKETIAALSASNQKLYFAWRQSIKHLMASYNGLYDTRTKNSVKHQASVDKALKALEAGIDDSIDRMNAWLKKAVKQ